MCYVIGISSLSEIIKNNFYLFLSRKGEAGCVFAVFFAPVPEKGILDFIAHCSLFESFPIRSRFGKFWWIDKGAEASYVWRGLLASFLLEFLYRHG